LIFLHDLHQTARDDEEDPPDHFAAVVGFRQIDPSVSNPVIEGPSQPRLNSMQQHRKRTYTISGISPSHSSAGGTGTSIPWPHILSDSFSSVDKTVTKQHPHIYQCSSISIPRSLLTRIFPSLSTPKTRQFLRSPRHIPPPAGFFPPFLNRLPSPLLPKDPSNRLGSKKMKLQQASALPLMRCPPLPTTLIRISLVTARRQQGYVGRPTCLKSWSTSPRSLYLL
jgi:hypothetical protein